MTWFRWWHRNVRFFFKPKNQTVAERWHKKLSSMYVFLSWNVLGIMVAIIYQNGIKNTKDNSKESTEGLSKAQEMALSKGNSNAIIYRFKGFHVETLPTPKVEPDTPQEELKV